MLEALRDGGERTLIVRYGELWEQMETYMQLHRGKTLDDPNTVSDMEHATNRAAVAVLMDKYVRGRQLATVQSKHLPV